MSDFLLVVDSDRTLDAYLHLYKFAKVSQSIGAIINTLKLRRGLKKYLFCFVISNTLIFV